MDKADPIDVGAGGRYGDQIGLGDAMKLQGKLHADDPAEREMQSQQQRSSLSGTQIDKNEVFVLYLRRSKRLRKLIGVARDMGDPMHAISPGYLKLGQLGDAARIDVVLIVEQPVDPLFMDQPLGVFSISPRQRVKSIGVMQRQAAKAVRVKTFTRAR
jgi:hypothetical protein